MLSKAKLLLYILIYNYFKFLFQKYFLNLVKSFLTLIKFNFDSLSRKIKNPYLVINKNYIQVDDNQEYLLSIEQPYPKMDKLIYNGRYEKIQ